MQFICFQPVSKTLRLFTVLLFLHLSHLALSKPVRAAPASLLKANDASADGNETSSLQNAPRDESRACKEFLEISQTLVEDARRRNDTGAVESLQRQFGLLCIGNSTDHSKATEATTSGARLLGRQTLFNHGRRYDFDRIAKAIPRLRAFHDVAHHWQLFDYTARYDQKFSSPRRLDILNAIGEIQNLPLRSGNAASDLLQYKEEFSRGECKSISGGDDLKPAPVKLSICPCSNLDMTQVVALKNDDLPDISFQYLLSVFHAMFNGLSVSENGILRSGFSGKLGLLLYHSGEDFAASPSLSDSQDQKVNYVCVFNLGITPGKKKVQSP